MDSLTLSTPLSHQSLAVCRLPSHHQTPPNASSFLFSKKALSPSVKCSSPFHHQTLACAPSQESLLLNISASSPQNPETSMRAAEADAMGLLLRERIVFLGCEIDDFVADAIIGQLLLLDAQDSTKDIRLFINSSGGSLSATMAIFDVVRLVRADVSTIALGISASTSAIILTGGTKGKRFAMPNSRIMIHQPLGSTHGDVEQVQIQAKELAVNKANIIRILSRCTGRSMGQVKKDIDRDRYMSPIEAAEYGIIDGVIDRERIIPLKPVPKRSESTIHNSIRIFKDPMKFITPEIPDDEIY